MQVKVIGESGYDAAVLGFSLSYNSSLDRVKEILPNFAFGIPGEDKFLESIDLWIDVSAPRTWWQEADTYRLSTKQSGSTMHTLMKNKLSQEDFEVPVWEPYLEHLNEKISEYKLEKDPATKKRMKKELKCALPEGYLQRRIWHMNYKTFKNIYNQRKSHDLDFWQKLFPSHDIRLLK